MGRYLWLPIAIAVVLAPLYASGYIIYLLDLVGIFALVAIGLNILTGFSGQISLGHSAFFAIGAYATALGTERLHVPLLLSLLAATLLAAAIGALVALPALRLQDLYLAVATLAFAIVVRQVIAQAKPLTGGGGGMAISAATLGPLRLDNDRSMFWLIFAFLALAIWSARNLQGSKTGRALVMVRESEFAARSLGIDVARVKVTAFALSASYAAIGGGLYAFLLRYLNPEVFGVDLSIAFVSMIVIGGLATIPGSIIGAGFYVIVPELLRGIKSAPGLVFGIAILLVMLFLPRGIWGLVTRGARAR